MTHTADQAAADQLVAQFTHCVLDCLRRIETLTLSMEPGAAETYRDEIDRLKEKLADLQSAIVELIPPPAVENRH